MENLFTFPVVYLLQILLERAPAVAAVLGVSAATESIVLVTVLSAIIWPLAIIACWGTVMTFRRAYRITESLIRTACFRAKQAAGSAKTWVICNYGKLLPHRRSAGVEETPVVQFDDFDFTVLQAAAECGPGFSTSAVELAEKFGLRPSQFQKSLGNLRNNKLVTTVIGSTEGFDNYRVTDHGVAYLRMWEQRKAG